MSHSAAPRIDCNHHRLYDFAKAAFIKIFVHPYATVCDLYCGGGLDEEKWDEAQIGHYIGIDVSSSGIGQIREVWESKRKVYTSQFFEIDPCVENIEGHLQEKTNSVDLVCCLQHLQLCFQTEERARRLLLNVSSLLKPGGYFLGITPDSSTLWAKYQKNVEAYHNKSSSVKPNIVPNCIRSENYMITFENEEEKFPFFGKKYQLKFANDIPAETHCLVHFPSFIRLAREAGLEYMEIQNLTEFYDDNRVELGGMLLNMGPSLVDPRGRFLPRAYDVLGDAFFGICFYMVGIGNVLVYQFSEVPFLFGIFLLAGLYTTFIFQKPDPDSAPPLSTPLLQDPSYNRDEREWQGNVWRDDETTTVHAEPPVPPALPVSLVPPVPPIGLGNISEQKGILGPGPAELRFSEAL